MTKAYSIFLTVLFTVFIGGVLVISALLPKEEFSEMENRFLQKPPELSIAVSYTHLTLPTNSLV